MLILLAVLGIVALVYLAYCIDVAFGIYQDSKIPEDPKDPRRRFWYVHMFLWLAVRGPLAALLRFFAEVAAVLAGWLLWVSEWVEG